MFFFSFASSVPLCFPFPLFFLFAYFSFCLFWFSLISLSFCFLAHSAFFSVSNRGMQRARADLVRERTQRPKYTNAT